MATSIAQLPNEIPSNKVVLKVEEKNKKVPDPPTRKNIEPIKELSQESIHQIVAGLQQAGGATLLPNREITTTDTHITQDKEVKPNFIPETNNNNYIEDESSMESLLQQNKNKKKELDRLDLMYEELQTPIMVMILFFFFQLPIFEKTMIKHLPSLFLRDGNPKFSGYFIKTLLDIYYENKNFL